MKKGCFWAILAVDVLIVVFTIYYILVEGVMFESFYFWLFLAFALFVVLISIPLAVYLFITISEATIKGEIPKPRNLWEYYFAPVKIDSPYGKKIEILTKVLIASIAVPLQTILIMALIRDIIARDFSFLRGAIWIVLQIVVLFVLVPKLELKKNYKR